MNGSIILKDLKRNKGINAILFLFIVFSSTLIVLSSLLGSQTILSIQELYRVAMPPHFLQMHKGEIDQEAIQVFMSENEDVIDWQIVQTINVSGGDVTVANTNRSYDLTDFKLDIGLVRQNETKDLLLDSSHQKVHVAKGEIGIPVLMRAMYDINLGDRVLISNDKVNMTFVVSHFILDAQMNSPLTSSTRILLSDEDFQQMAGYIGENEYLIEAYFDDVNTGSTFKTAYENAGLPQNGQAVTYQIIFLLSAMTDIIMVFVMLFASALVIIVSFICLRFTILSTLEEELVEIGTMKAIGFSYKHIRSIYLDKYRVLTILGTLSGLALAFQLDTLFSRHIGSTFGKLQTSGITIVLSLVAAILIYSVTLSFCRSILRKIKKLTVVETLVYGEGFTRKGKADSLSGLTKLRIKSINVLLSLRDVFFHFRKWLTVFFVVSISFVLMSLPTNLYRTFVNPQFITYMGSSVEHILVQVEESQALEANYMKAKQVIMADDAVASFHESRKVRVKVQMEDGESLNLDIDSGNVSGDELKYLSGVAPTSATEVAISYLNSEALGKTTGDTLALIHGDEIKNFRISGVYQDVTSGGLTAKSKYDFADIESKRYAFSVNLKDGVDVQEKADKWSQLMGFGVSVDSMDDFINQTLGGVIKQLESIVIATFMLGIFLAMLITVLFLKLRLIKDYSEISVLKAIGFSNLDMRNQYVFKTGITAFLGALFGIVLTRVFGESMINLILSFSGLGLKKVTLMSSALFDFVVYPFVLLAVVLLATIFVVKQIKNFNLIALINE
jgi:putative ABC transport system permease protein